GKAPHTHGIFVGGVTAIINAEKILEAQGIVAEIIGFINSRMIKDVITIGKYYNDYFKIGQSHGNFMSYGLFESYDGGKYVPRKIILKDGQELDIDPNKITQNIYNAWYSSNNVEFNIANESWEANPKNPTGYSFIKAPRYDGMPMEVGPLARTYISGLYREGSSTMNRLMARVLEAKEIAEGIRRLLQKVKSEPPSYKKFIMPEEAFGFDLHDTTRGALAHFVGIKNKLIDRYTIITPSGWNLSPTDSKGIKGTIEQALIGSFIENPKDPIELGRIVRSFDPCVSCGTHVISNKTSLVEIRVV
ncbi:MAG: nickel-dependent hydrogenase large subunit, partial [Peptostreptococcaceae bacterium]